MWKAEWPDKEGAYWFYGLPTLKHSFGLWLVTCYRYGGISWYYCDGIVGGNISGFKENDDSIGMWMEIPKPELPTKEEADLLREWKTDHEPTN